MIVSSNLSLKSRWTLDLLLFCSLAKVLKIQRTFFFGSFDLTLANIYVSYCNSSRCISKVVMSSWKIWSYFIYFFCFDLEILQLETSLNIKESAHSAKVWQYVWSCKAYISNPVAKHCKKELFWHIKDVSLKRNNKSRQLTLLFSYTLQAQFNCNIHFCI